MSSVSILVGKSGPTSGDQAFRKLAEFHGLSTEFVTPDNLGSPRFLATSASSLEEAGPDLQLGQRLGPGSTCFVHHHPGRGVQAPTIACAQNNPIENENLPQLKKLAEQPKLACAQNNPIENENLPQLKAAVEPSIACAQNNPIENENLPQLKKLAEQPKLACAQNNPIENENLPQLKKSAAEPDIACAQNNPIENENLPQLAKLTGNAVTGIKTAPAGKVTFAVRTPFPQPRHPMTGVHFSADTASLSTLAPGSQFASADVHLTLNDQPYFVGVQNQGVKIWVLSDHELIDLDALLAAGADLSRWHAQILAISAAFGAAFGAAGWTQRDELRARGVLAVASR
ncbi:MAG TPA: hypothetical protein VGL42_16120 [Opitutaceae bacterium]|jgi:hypothetical protein